MKPMLHFMEMLSGLFVGGRKTFSLGRVAFWLVFGLSIYFWACRPPEAFPTALEYSLYCLMAYNFGGKAVNKLGAAAGGAGPDSTEAAPRPSPPAGRDEASDQPRADHAP